MLYRINLIGCVSLTAVLDKRQHNPLYGFCKESGKRHANILDIDDCYRVIWRRLLGYLSVL
jgi:hypothetical protein